MKAWVLHGVGDIRLEAVPEPKLKAGEVLIAVRAAGICGSDIPRIYQTGAHVHPLIPGHEFSGEVVQAGPGMDGEWLGKRVGIFPLIPCGSCGPCRRKRYEMCRNYDYLGSRRDGGFAEYVAVPAKNLLELPDSVSFEEAAMLEPMAVAVHAIRRLALRPEETVAICGLGTIGLLLVMFLQEAGIKNILAVGNKSFQKQTLLKLGTAEDCFCDCREQNAAEWLLERTDGAGVDNFFECVGKNETVSLAVRAAAPGGRICLVGNPASDMKLEKNVYWKILRNQLEVTGTWNSSFTGHSEDDWHYVLERLEKEAVWPKELITHVIPLDKLEHGLSIMLNKTGEFVKTMCVSS